MVNQTYIRILQAIEAFSSEHLQIKRFKSDFPEQLPNFASEDESYPILFVSPSTSIFDSNINRFDIVVYCYDIIEKDRENINTIVSDTNQILNDLYRWLKFGDIEGIDVLSTSNSTPINNDLLDYCAGYQMSLTLDVDTYSICEIPFENQPSISIKNDIVYSKYLTCETLSDCGVIQDIENNISSITASINTFIPYSGANDDVDLGTYSLSSSSINLEVGFTQSIEVGKIVFNSEDGTFDMGLLNGVTLQSGQEQHMYGKASEAIANGDAIQFAGAQGNHILFKKAVPSELNNNPEYFIGVATQDFTINEFGYVTIFGKVRDLDTDDFEEGDVLYFDSMSLSNGGLTNTRPIGPNAKITVAAVLRKHQNQGTILVRPHIVTRLGGLQDVEFGTVNNNDVLVYNDTLEVWENNNIFNVIGYTPASNLDSVLNNGNTSSNNIILTDNNDNTINIDKEFIEVENSDGTNGAYLYRNLYGLNDRFNDGDIYSNYIMDAYNIILQHYEDRVLSNSIIIDNNLALLGNAGNINITANRSQNKDVNITAKRVSVKTGNYNGYLSTDNLSNERTYQLPDASGTVSLTSDLDNKVNKFIQVDGITVSVAGWTGSTPFQYTYSNVNITNSSIIDVIPDNTGYSIVSAAQILPRIDVGTGSMIIYSNNIPTGDFGISIIINNN